MIDTIKAVFTGVGKLFGFLNNRQLINAGVEKERAKNSGKLLENVERSNVVTLGLDDPDNRRRVRDRFNRDK